MITFTNLHGKKHQRGRRANPKARSTLTYIFQKTNQENQKDKCVLSSIVNLEASIKQFESVRDRSNSLSKEKEVHHFAIGFPDSFDANNKQDQLIMGRFAERVFEELFPEHDTEWAVHADTDNPHVNGVTNAFNRNTSKKLHMDMKFFVEHAYPIINKIEREFGWEETDYIARIDKNREERKHNQSEKISDGDYQVEKYRKGGWKGEIYDTVRMAKYQATSIEEFDKILIDHDIRRYHRSKTKFGYEHLRRLKTHAKHHSRITNGNRMIKEKKLTFEDVTAQIKINNERELTEPTLSRSRSNRNIKKKFPKKKNINKVLFSASPHEWIKKRQHQEMIFEMNRERLKSCTTEEGYYEELKRIEIDQEFEEREELVRAKEEELMRELEKLNFPNNFFEEKLDKLFDNFLEKIFEGRTEFSTVLNSQKKKDSKTKRRNTVKLLEKKGLTRLPYDRGMDYEYD